jgi:subfamily B ATP-binding cassette protein MsbA
VVAEEGLQGIRVVKCFGREDYETQQYVQAMTGAFRASLQMAVYNFAPGSVMGFLGFSSIAAIMWYGGREVMQGHLTLAMITGFLMYGIPIAASLGRLGGLYAQLSAAIGGVQRVFEILDTPPSVLDAPDAGRLPAARGRIIFENVSFTSMAKPPFLGLYTGNQGGRDPRPNRSQWGGEEHHLQPHTPGLRSDSRNNSHR